MDVLLEVVSMLICFDENAKVAGRVVACSYIAFALGLFGLNCLPWGYGGCRCPVNKDLD